MINKILTIIYYIVSYLNKKLRSKDAAIAANREKAIETLRNTKATKEDKLNALRDLSK